MLDLLPTNDIEISATNPFAVKNKENTTMSAIKLAGPFSPTSSPKDSSKDGIKAKGIASDNLFFGESAQNSPLHNLTKQ